MNENRNHRKYGIPEEKAEFLKEQEADVSASELQEVRKQKWNEERAEVSLRVFAEYCRERQKAEVDEIEKSSRDIEIPESLAKKLDEMAERLEAEKKKDVHRRKVKSLSKKDIDPNVLG